MVSVPNAVNLCSFAGSVDHEFSEYTRGTLIQLARDICRANTELAFDIRDPAVAQSLPREIIATEEEEENDEDHENEAEEDGEHDEDLFQ
jgi:hypothetical protein